MTGTCKIVTFKSPANRSSNTVGYNIGRAVRVVNVPPERAGMALIARANQYDHSNALRLIGSQHVLSVPESSIYAIGKYLRIHV
jgi:hypothetical protein